MTAPFLVLLDVDGTLQDSQAIIVDTIRVAFAEVGLAPPMRDTILRTVGLSVPRMLEALVPGGETERVTELLSHYRLRFARAVAADAVGGGAPLFPGIPEGLDRLEAAGAVLGIATGKSARGLRAFLDVHGWGTRFATLQHADVNPSKPHPAMIRKALAATGMPVDRAAMVGDTAFDMEMARAAGIAAIAVCHGYHDCGTLRRGGADGFADDFGEVVDILLERFA